MLLRQCAEIILLLILIPPINSAHIGFFCNVGAYSHDKYSNYLADKSAQYGGHNASFIQINIFKSSKKFPLSTKRGQIISHDFTNDTRTMKAQRAAQKLTWEMFMPFDLYNFSLIGIRAAMKIEKSFLRGCASALENRTFINQLRNLKLNLAIIDYGLNECAIGLASVLNIPIAYITSHPIATHYLEHTGIPSTPAYAPTITCNYEPYENFWDRAYNAFGHTISVIFRRVYYNRISRVFFDKLKIKLIDIIALEKRLVMFATPWEMLLDSPRPVARNLRYFGCETCLVDTDNQDNVNFIDKSVGVILVSFGTLANVEDIPVHKLQSLMKSFAYFARYTFIWQLDISIDYIQEAVLNPINMKMPKNVRLHRWIPIKSLLADPKVLLIITHGGATTCLEAAYAGTPIFGIAIHSDQYYNTQRFAQKGLAEAMTVLDIDSEQDVILTLSVILANHRMYKRRAMKFREMLAEHRNFEKSSSGYWINFMANHFVSESKTINKKLDKFWILRYSANWLVYPNGDVTIMILLFNLFLALFL